MTKRKELSWTRPPARGAEWLRLVLDRALENMRESAAKLGQRRLKRSASGPSPTDFVLRGLYERIDTLESERNLLIEFVSTVTAVAEVDVKAGAEKLKHWNEIISLCSRAATERQQPLTDAHEQQTVAEL